MKIEKILSFEDVYPKLKELPLNIKVAYTLSKIHQMALADVQFYHNSFTNIISKYAERDEIGNIKTSDDEKFIPIKEEDVENCQKELEALQQFDIPDYDKLKISLSDLGNIQITPEELDKIISFIEE